MALKDVDLGVKVLGGLTAFALLMALISNGDPENDAWGDSGAAEASTSTDDGSGPGPSSDDPWTEGSDDEDGWPVCDHTAPFAVDGGTVRLPVAGPITPLASPDCRVDDGGGGAEAVSLVQQALVQCNGQSLVVDGAYGSATSGAVAAVQSQHDITVDGAYGPETRSVMSWPIVAGDGEGAASCGTVPGSL